MKAYAVGLLTGAVLLLSAPAAGATPAPEPSPEAPPATSAPPGAGGGALFPMPGFPFASLPPGLTLPEPPEPSLGATSPGGLPPGRDTTGSPPPSPPGEGESTGTGPSPSSPAPRSWQPAGKGETPPSGGMEAPPLPTGTPSPSSARPAADGGGETEGDEGNLAFRGGEPLLPVLPLGAGLASLGLGLAAFALRLRRRA